MQKLFLILGSLTMGSQVLPLTISQKSISIEKNSQQIKIHRDLFAENKAKIEFNLIKGYQKYTNLSAVFESWFNFNDLYDLDQEDIQQELAEALNSSKKTSLPVTKDPKIIQNYLSSHLKDKVEKGFKIQSYKDWDEKEFQKDFLKVVRYSISKMQQPFLIIKESIRTEDHDQEYLIWGYDDETQEISYFSTEDSYKTETVSYNQIEKLFGSRDFSLAATKAMNNDDDGGTDPDPGPDPGDGDLAKIKEEKQELPYYHLPAALSSILPVWDLEKSQNELYRELRKVTNTPNDIEGVTIENNDAIPNYVNKLIGNTNFSLKGLGNNFGLIHREMILFNEAVAKSLEGNHPIILVNQSNSFVINKINIDDDNPWLSTYSGMNPEKGKFVKILAQQLIRFNHKTSYVLGLKTALEKIDADIKASETKIERQTAVETNLEGDVTIKAMKIEINLTALTSLQNISEIKKNFAVLELQDFIGEILQIDGNYKEINGLKISTKDIPEDDREFWRSPQYEIGSHKDETKNETIETWIKSSIVLEKDYLSDLNLTIEVLVGATITTNQNQIPEPLPVPFRLSGKVKLDSGEIFKIDKEKEDPDPDPDPDSILGFKLFH